MHTYLPSSFCAQLRDNAPDLTLEGPASEYNFADVKDAVTNFEPIKSPFDTGSPRENSRNPQSARPYNQDVSPIGGINIANSSDTELAKKVKDLNTEL